MSVDLTKKTSSDSLRVVKTGLLAGTLDGATAGIHSFILTGRDPMNAFRFIATGVFGPPALSGGLDMALWGILFHFCIAFWWTLLYFALYPRVSLLLRNRYLSGVVYAAIVWIAMNAIVIPVSHVPSYRHSTEGIIVGILLLILGIGLPISISASRWYSRSDAKVTPSRDTARDDLPANPR